MGKAEKIVRSLLLAVGVVILYLIAAFASGVPDDKVEGQVVNLDG